MNDHFLAAALLALTMFTANLPLVRAQTPQAASTPAASQASMTAVLIDAEKKAQQKAATVQIRVRGVNLVDPALSKEKPVAGQAHLHYQLDDGPIVATPAAKLSWHGLKSGDHTIVISLAANDHSPLGPSETLAVRIP